MASKEQNSTNLSDNQAVTSTQDEQPDGPTLDLQFEASRRNRLLNRKPIRSTKNADLSHIPNIDHPYLGNVTKLKRRRFRSLPTAEVMDRVLARRAARKERKRNAIKQEKQNTEAKNVIQE